MSDMEYHKGNAKVVLEDFTDAQLYYFFKALDKEDLIDFDVEEMGSRSCFVGESQERLGLDNKYAVVDNRLFELENERYDYEVSMMVKLNKTNYVYCFSFYNGSSCFSEEFEESVRAEDKKSPK